jgi:hypothetical protein
MRPGMTWHIPVISVTWEAEAGDHQFKASTGKMSARLYLKNKLNQKGMGGVAQVIERLASQVHRPYIQSSVLQKRKREGRKEEGGRKEEEGRGRKEEGERRKEGRGRKEKEGRGRKEEGRKKGRRKGRRKEGKERRK